MDLEEQSNIGAVLPSIGFVREKVVLSMIPISPSSWWAGIKAGKYPKPVKLGPNTSAWRVEEIRELIKKLSENG
jgi:prophage regulatory protein